MSEKGRPRKPTALKVLEGNPGKRPLPRNEPKPAPIAPECPKWLAPEAKKLWAQLMPELERLGLMTIVDGVAFSGICQRYATWVKCERYLKKHGLTFETESGYTQQRPEVAIGQKALADVRAFCSDFGLTPASRSRIEVQLPEEGKDPTEALLSGVR